MPLLTKVGRRALKSRVIVACLYCILVVGAVSMLYPFLLMVSTSLCGKIDYLDYKLIPAYLFDDTALFRRYLAERSEKISVIASEYQEPAWVQFNDITIPEGSSNISQIGKDWDEFRVQLPADLQATYFSHAQNADNYLFSATNEYRKWLQEQYEGDLGRVNRLYLQTAEKFRQLLPPNEDHAMHKWHPAADAKTDDWLRFKKTLPPEFIQVVSIDHVLGKFLRRQYATVEACNEDLGTHFTSLYATRFEEEAPQNPRYLAVWEEFVREWCPVLNITLDSERCQGAFEAFLDVKYGNAAAYNEIHEGGEIAAFSEVKLSSQVPRKESMAADWSEFVEQVAPLGAIGFRTPDSMYRRFLEQRYGDITRLNEAYQTRYASLKEIGLPYKEADCAFFQAQKTALRRGMVGINYRAATSFMVLHGRATVNTLVLVIAMLATALTVNPLAAYALSRFNLSYAPRVLLFLLATMAFPAEVVMIPNFLLIKELHLLNTYWALILPAMANAYTIFILKGFFDSLPKELFEEAIINGASEAYMFLHITLPMSKPVMAVVALWTFLAGYGAYMWAFLICQNEKMWTLMVYLFQFQMRNPPYAVMAAIALIAVPTLIVFVLTQRVILKGIITPSFT